MFRAGTTLGLSRYMGQKSPNKTNGWMNRQAQALREKGKTPTPVPEIQGKRDLSGWSRAEQYDFHKA